MTDKKDYFTGRGLPLYRRRIDEQELIAAGKLKGGHQAFGFWRVRGIARAGLDLLCPGQRTLRSNSSGGELPHQRNFSVAPVAVPFIAFAGHAGARRLTS